MLLTSSKCTSHPCVATLIPFLQNWCNWGTKSKRIVFTPTPKQTVQINASEYDSDIDGQIDTLPDLQSHAENNQEEPTPTTGDSEHPKLSQDTNRTDPQPKSVQNPAEYLPHQDAEPFLEKHQDRQRSQLEDIPELEDKDWEDGQFADADLIDHHNTKKENNLI